MPRKRSASAESVTSAFRQVQLQARSLMLNLRKEIRTKETELRRLKEEESRLSVLIGMQASARSGRAPSTRGTTGSARVNWHCSRAASQTVQGRRCSLDSRNQGKKSIGSVCRDHALDPDGIGAPRSARSVSKNLKPRSRFIAREWIRQPLEEYIQRLPNCYGLGGFSGLGRKNWWQ